MNIIIRDIPEVTAAAIKTAAAARNISQQELLSGLLNQAYGTPPTAWGYIKFDRPGDLNIGDDCPVCNQPAQSWWLRFASTGETRIMCGTCATSE